MLQLHRGYIALVGQDIDTLVQRALTSLTWKPTNYSIATTANPYHITVLTKDELRSLTPLMTPHQILDRLQKALSLEKPRLHDVGIGGHPPRKPNVFFVVVIWAKGQQLRKQFGLPPKQFHITLSKSDVHDIDKGVSTLLTPFPHNASTELLDHTTYTSYLLGDYKSAKAFAAQLCVEDSGSAKSFLRLGEAASKLAEHKLAMLSYACSFNCAGLEDTKILEYCLRKIIASSSDTEWGTVIAEHELVHIPGGLAPALMKPWSTELRSKLADSEPVPTLCRESREQLFVYSHMQDVAVHNKLPRFFRWLVPFYLAVMSTPRDAADIASLASPHIGIRHVLTLTEETPLKPEWFAGTSVKNTYLPVPNYQPPTIEQMDLIIRLLQDEDNLPMLIHCGGGKGRAGTVAACYLAAFGFRRIPSHLVLTQPTMAAPDAIAALRAIRPGSIETKQQEAFVGKWCSAIWKRQRVVLDLVSEPSPCALEIEGTLDATSNLFVLVGLPGAGKSWLSRALLERDPSGWLWISQDEAGGRAACETAIGRTPKGRVLLDRCNTAKDDRASWLALAGNWAKAPVCVWLDYEAKLCTSRAQNRADHPTLPPGGRVRSAVEQMHKQFVRPTLAEGFTTVIIIRSFAAAEEFVSRISPPVVLFKFPRTPHLLNLGAATDDDLVQSTLPFTSTVASPSTRVVITEKVDGANMGFSLSADRTQILVQNRSHYVNTASHEQFKKLGTWVDVHRADLYRVLDRDPLFAQRYVLFGEWLAATHSIAYTSLSDWFLAFDLYDRSTKSWVDRKTLIALLDGTGICIVPLLYEGSMVSEETLRKMVQGQSVFTDGRIEGIYVKWEKGGEVVSRGKVVRGDFIAGNEHWTRGTIRFNALALSSSTS